MWANLDNTSAHLIIPISKNDIFRANLSGIFQYTFLKSYTTPILGQKANLCAGYNRINGINDTNIVAPKDANYLYILIKYNSYNQIINNIYINNNEYTNLITLINNVKASLNSDISSIINNEINTVSFIDLSLINDKQYDTLLDALSEVPDRYKKGWQTIKYKDNSGKVYIYYFISAVVGNWNNTTLWYPIYTGEEVNTKLTELRNDVAGYINVNLYGIPTDLSNALSLIPSSRRYGRALISYRDSNESKNLYVFNSNEIDDTTWNAVSNWIKVTTNLELTTTLNKMRGVINVNNFITSTEPATLSDALALVPDSEKVGRAIIFYKDTNSEIKIYAFISYNVENWNNTSMWQPIYTGKQVDSLISSINTNINRLRGFINISNFQTGDNPKTLLEALALVPESERVARAVIHYVDSEGNHRLYLFHSFNISNWLIESAWYQVYTGKQIDELLDTLHKTINIEYKDAEPLISIGRSLKFKSNFNGTSSISKNKVLTFNTNGDYFEIEFYPNTSGNNGYAAVQRENNASISLGITNSRISVRGKDDVWILNAADSPVFTDTCLKVKVSYENDNILIYVNDTLIKTYTGQIETSIYGFGYNQFWNYWKGTIGNINLYSSTNNLTYSGTIDGLPEYTSTDVSFVRDEGFLTDEQNEKLQSITTYPNCVVYYNPTANGNNGRFWIYMREPNTPYYIGLDLNHVVDNTELVYLNIWRLSGEGNIFKYVNGSFVPQNIYPLLGVENEFTMHFDNADDFTGGYHGDERIDTDGSYVKFFIDGIPLTDEDLTSEFTKECNDFYMLSNATLHQTVNGGVVDSEHHIVGRHIKKTSFINRGFECENRVVFDFSNTEFTTREATVLFTGLVCVNKDCAISTYATDYNIIDTSSGDNSQTNINNANSSKVCFYGNKKLSCEIESTELPSDDNNRNIVIWNRPTDTKYYRYAPTRTVKTGDIYMSKVSVKWSYKV